MQTSLPSWRQGARFLITFYAATAVLFFNFFWAFGIFSLELSAIASLLWPTAYHPDILQTGLLVGGVAAAIADVRLTEVDN